ncbi:hypothetical protein BABINDRAFT_158975 [Babjeviella inositovora NRRL Y-12698]|uniref:Peptidase M3A/M3B catalytic domain-containing protein n=1 Tax=Babjeviella inositovora NRRL Y-12698 TaxID=984486 RepID=A0A1E3QZ54_9ASCO|nr:uncharacterized protein BABINDRAFT_158975 [Babjeviella inositovora NRRL Y-12698]ODQ82362.1 hypothetical protein BABINDRAFT_158975 [Babjeviella inositovora NRRL Y-12698]
MDQIIAAGKQLDDEIAAISAPTLESVITPAILLENTQSGPINQLTFYQHVATDKALRDASTDATKSIQDFSIESSSRVDVYKVWEKLSQDEAILAEIEAQPELPRYLRKVMTGFKRDGLALPDSKREQVKELNKKLADLSLNFSKNNNEEVGFLLFSREELEGVPADALAQFKEVDGQLKMTFKYPDILPVLKYAKHEETRKRVFVANQNKVPANSAILVEIVKLRTQLALTLGYDTYANYVLEERLAKRQDTVLEFLDDLKQKLQPLGAHEYAALLALKNADLRERGLPTAAEYYIWDNSFYDNLMIEQNYQVDHQKISEYFPIESVVPKILHFYETLFQLKFEEVTKDKSVWHEEVIQFAAWKLDNETPEFVGWLYMDLHPRDGKYSHAANFGLYPGYQRADGNRSYPATALVCNFSKPAQDKPSLLKHSEVETLLHEVGHGIHNLVGETALARFHGTKVARDFVEAPSQMLEYWTWSPAELKSLSQHYKTGEPIDDALIRALVATKHVNGAMFNLRQLHFALFDMTLHTVKSNAEADALDFDALWNDLREEISLVKNGGEVTHGYGTFGHIGGSGYAAGYYGYLYSQVFAADIYYTLFKADPMNVVNGLRYRDIILKRGGSNDEMDNLVELLKRQPTSEAFLTELGVATKSNL